MKQVLPPSPIDGIHNNSTVTSTTTTTTTTTSSQRHHPHSQPIYVTDVHGSVEPHNDDYDDDDDACSDDDSIIVHFTKRTSLKPLQLSTLQQHEQEMDRRSKSLKSTTSAAMTIPVVSNTTQRHLAPTTTIFTKTTSKTSTRSTHSSTTFRIPTCCGVIELNLVRFLSLFGMIVNICCFLAVAVVVGNSFKLEAKKEISLLLQRASFLQLYDQMNCMVRLAVTTGSLSYIPLYEEKQANSSRVLLEMSKNLPADVLSKTKFDPKSPGYIKYNQQAMESVRQGDLLAANKILKSFNYQVWDGYTTYFIVLVDNEIKKLSEQKQEYLRYASTVNMVLVLAGVALSIPIVITIFVLALTSEQASSRKLKKATSIMILETLSNEKTSRLFKEFCEKENKLDKYTFLENCHTYREMCDKSVELRRTKLNIGDEESNRDQIKDIEKNKYEMAFKIFTEFIDINGENPFPSSVKFQDNIKNKLDEFSTESPTLDEHLFDELEKDICDSLTDSFMKFKKELRKKQKNKQ